ncbi:MAG: hypothetical protein J5I94_16780, partial [Phaeodactylibacter sp.]|nr:hypothetical protein [Phaeodactylibacter sp.]
MSKKRKSPAGKKQRVKPSAPLPPKAAPKVGPERPEQVALCKKVFRYSVVGILLITILMSLFSGINGD